jgi:serine/threonine-protein kinase
MTAAFARRWQEIEPLLDALFDVPAAGRADWLRRHCADETLRTLVVQALDDVAGAEGLERGVAQWLPALAGGRFDALPSVAGYRVLRFVGAGGMASVFEAERELPGGPQTVALKLLRIDVHDPDERRRFLREQRILARLRHPHVAQLLDAGFTPAGTPFLALEFVAGDGILAHCERRGLDARARLALFLDVCAAVEHAHRGLVVHRDLKPSNVLVGADGVVKLVDFGIAKLLDGEDEPTRTGAQRLTRAYAAPEQLAGAPATTAIDVYALGVLLCELLGGARPSRGGMVDDAALRRRLGADLHAIVREATQPDPQRRYAGVAALREDVERHLEGLPLRARAGSFAYRALTSAKRHALALALGAAVAAVLVGATAVSAYESRRARRSAQEAQAQTLVAEGQARRAEALKTFLEGLFDGASPSAKKNETAADLLARGRERAERDFATQPGLRAEILALLGDLQRRSGYPDRARPALEEAAALAGAQFGAADARTLHVATLLAKDLDELGLVADARMQLRKALDAFEAEPGRSAPQEVSALAWLAGLEERGGESAQAIELGGKALALARRALPEDSDVATEAVTNLGWILMDAGHADRAEPLLREALARKRSRFGERHAEVADAMEYLTLALIRLGRYGEGERLMRDALAVDAQVYANPHTHLAWHQNELAVVLSLEGRLAEADAFFARSIEVCRALGAGSALAEAVTLGNRARIRLQQGEYSAAEAGFRDMIERKQRLLGAGYDDNGRSYDRAGLADVLIARGRLDEARTLIDAALASARGRYRQAHPDTAYVLTVQARLAVAGGDRERAAANAHEAVAMYAALADWTSEKSIRARLLYGETLRSLGRDAEAGRQFEGALASIRASTPNPPALFAHAGADLALVRESLGESAAARALRAEVGAALAGPGSEPSVERDEAMRLLADARIPSASAERRGGREASSSSPRRAGATFSSSG